MNNLQSLKVNQRGNPLRWFVSESGLYKLIMRSNLKEAREFQDWVAKVVLPAIREDGAYIEGEEKLASIEMSEDEFVFKAMEIMQEGYFTFATSKREIYGANSFSILRTGI